MSLLPWKMDTAYSFSSNARTGPEDKE